MLTYPEITVVIPTRDRPDDVRRCLASVAGVRYPRWEVHLVDQSDDGETQNVTQDFPSLAGRLTYRRMQQKGASAARNEGLAEARGDIVAFLDDDCAVEPEWLMTVAAAFQRHPEAAAVYGTVRGIVDNARYYVPSYEARAERIVKGRLAILEGAGMSAAMYVRRSVLEDIGPWDIHLGPGSHFPNCDDWDYTYRILAGGFSLVTTPAITVNHFGGRAYESGAARRHWRITAYSEGAMHMKLLRCGDPFAPVLMAARLWRNAIVVRPLNLLLRRGNSHIARLPMYLRGLFASFELRVDRKQRLYITH